ARRWSGSPARLVGVHFAVDRSSDGGGIPDRTAVVGVALAMAAIVATLMFAASTRHLLTTPSAYGWTWDVQFGTDHLDDVAHLPGIAGVSSVLVAPTVLGGNAGSLRGIHVVSGEPPMRMLSGRAVEHRGEIVIGRRTARRLHLGL